MIIVCGNVNTDLFSISNGFTEKCSDSVDSGDIILGNCDSFINLLVMQYNYSPLYVVNGEKGKVYLKTFHGLLFERVFRLKPSVKNLISFEKALNYAKESHSPLVVYPSSSGNWNNEYLIDAPVSRFFFFHFYSNDNIHSLSFAKTSLVYQVYCCLSVLTREYIIFTLPLKETPNFDNKSFNEVCTATFQDLQLREYAWKATPQDYD